MTFLTSDKCYCLFCKEQLIRVYKRLHYNTLQFIVCSVKNVKAIQINGNFLRAWCYRTKPTVTATAKKHESFICAKNDMYEKGGEKEVKWKNAEQSNHQKQAPSEDIKECFHFQDYIFVRFPFLRTFSHVFCWKGAQKIQLIQSELKEQVLHALLVFRRNKTFFLNSCKQHFQPYAST